MSDPVPEHDDRTGRGYPLPHRENTLNVDADRLRDAVTKIDADITAVEVGLASIDAVVTGLGDRVTAVAASLAQVKQPAEIAGIPPVIDLPCDGPDCLPSGVVQGGSGKWVTRPSGLLTWAPAGTPPIDYDPVTGTWHGLLAEEMRTNLLLWSSGFGAAWSKFGAVTVTGDAVAAPDGTLTADKIGFGAGTAGFYQNVTVTSGVTVTGSIWLRADTPTTVSLISNDTPSTGVVSKACGLTTTWRRFDVSRSTPNTTVNLQVSGPGTAVVIYAWGAQLEVGSSPTSYIPTASSAVTRAADLNVLSLSRVDGWNATEGTLLLDFIPGARNNNWNRAVGLDDGTGNNVIHIVNRGNTASLYAAVIADGAAVADFQAFRGPDVLFALQRVAIAWAANDFGFSVNGGNTVTDLSGAVPLVTRITFGTSSVTRANGWLRRVTVFPRRLPNPTLPLLTAL
ncbi:hypothetical protein M2352_003935 [Azospirillum fermentarium]|uniref:phage head spike fiber domain-containing protein n=1 Tax=Azospirillum fermentarium TaxID=1233114 RepID=UPI002226B9EF|nr:hypothetical protein [Azospirillum fermentarium]MCW2248301.1 hypothetical protein [Azospirillum fermentarium]